MLVSCLPQWRSLSTTSPPSTTFEDNTCYFTAAPLKKASLPRDPTCSWNRSNGTVVLEVQKRFRVHLSKFNSRRKKNSPNQSSHKIWTFAVTLIETGEEFAFVWCTNGKPRASRSKREEESSFHVTSATAPRPVPTPSPSSHTQEEEADDSPLALLDSFFDEQDPFWPLPNEIALNAYHSMAEPTLPDPRQKNGYFATDTLETGAFPHPNQANGFSASSLDHLPFIPWQQHDFGGANAQRGGSHMPYGWM